MENNFLQENITKAIEIISLRKQGEEIKKFDVPYIHSNEGDFYKNLNLQNKSVLTVGSSGDQALYSLLNGAKDVTVFDMNPFVKYYYELKASAVMNLSRKESLKLFSLKPWKEKVDFSATLNKLKEDMSSDSAEFWTALSSQFSHREIFTCFFERYASKMPNYMEDKKSYEALGNILRASPNVNFICSNLHNLPQHLDDSVKYDCALVSNVMDYYTDRLQYKEDVMSLLPYLSKDAVMQVNYSYEYKNARNHIKFPHKLESVENLFVVDASNVNIYPHLRDVIPNPDRNVDSFALPYFREHAIFVRADDLRQEENAEEISEQDVSANEVPIEVSEEAPAVRDAELFRKFEERIEPKENVEEACQQMIPSDNSEE